MCIKLATPIEKQEEVHKKRAGVIFGIGSSGIPGKRQRKERQNNLGTKVQIFVKKLCEHQ
jgi:hypothetical protein